MNGEKPVIDKENGLHGDTIKKAEIHGNRRKQRQIYLDRQCTPSEGTALDDFDRSTRSSDDMVRFKFLFTIPSLSHVVVI